MQRGPRVVIEAATAVRTVNNCGEQIHWTRSRLSKQYLHRQQAFEKEWIWIMKPFFLFFFFPFAKNRHDEGNLKPPGIPLSSEHLPWCLFSYL